MWAFHVLKATEQSAALRWPRQRCSSRCTLSQSDAKAGDRSQPRKDTIGQAYTNIYTYIICL